eukprot:11547761-Alexandrium_andersonii.AAC.1
MAWHNGFQPSCDLPGATSGPGADHHGGDGNGPEARDQGHLVVQVLGEVNLSPAPQGRWSAGPFARRQKGKQLLDGFLWQACDLLGSPGVRARRLAAPPAGSSGSSGAPVLQSVGGRELLGDALDFRSEGQVH